MERIRVDTDELKTKSKAFETSAGVFAQAGKDILAYTASLPSYDGQLSTPARAAALEINRQCQDVHSSYMSDSQSLARTAQAFADVDNQTVDVFRENTALMSNAPIYGGPGGENDAPKKQGGNPDLLSYKDYGDYVIIWKFGEVHTIFVTDENRPLVEKYEKDVDEYCKDLAELLETIQGMILRGMDTTTLVCLLLILIGLGVIAGEILGAVLTALHVAPEIIEAARALLHEYEAVRDLADFEDYEKLAGIIDPENPAQWFDDIKNISQEAKATGQAFFNAESDWNALVPAPTLSGPTPVPAPTPPTPTQTPTPPAP
jgi:hypothetical protein